MQFRFSLSDLPVWPFVRLKGRICEPSIPLFTSSVWLSGSGVVRKRKRERGERERKRKRIEHATTTSTIAALVK